jgi:UDPglucose 6-dehydrogenase
MAREPTIAYMGMTHLGLCSAIAAASKGFTVLGFDENPDLVTRLTAHELPVVEPELDELLLAHRERMIFSADLARLAACDVVYVAPDVPTDDHGQSDLTRLERLLDLAFTHAGQDAVIVILSQVPPGFTRARHRSGRILHYQVETLVFGRAVERATMPERFIVGCHDPKEPLPAAYRAFLDAFRCPILPMRFESAELTKISINCCLVSSITVANTLAELCEQIRADWSEIAPALKLDRRIGMYSYLSPGLGLAGGNLERDLATVIRFSEEYGTDASVIKAFVGNSSHCKDWVLRRLHSALLDKHPSATIGILGLAYKENTHSVKNSPSLALIRNLHPWPIRVFDPVVSSSVVSHPSVTGADSALDAAHGVDAVAIMTPWPEFRSVSCDALASAMKGRLVLDPYRVLNPEATWAAGLHHYVIGVS